MTMNGKNAYTRILEMMKSGAVKESAGEKFAFLFNTGLLSARVVDNMDRMTTQEIKDVVDNLEEMEAPVIRKALTSSYDY